MDGFFLESYKIIRKLKATIYSELQRRLDPEVWATFLESGVRKDEDADLTTWKPYYTIYNHDLPSIRDIKAFLNMCTAMERLSYTCHVNEKLGYAELLAHKLLDIFSVTEFDDVSQFKENYKIFMSTESPLANYFVSQAKSKLVWIKDMCSALTKIAKFYVTKKNVQRVGEGFIDFIIRIERYQQRYIESKKIDAKTSAASKPNSDGVIAAFVRKNDTLLKWFYGEDYDRYFVAKNSEQVKADSKSQAEKTRDYYPEYLSVSEKKLPSTMVAETITIKHIKRLFAAFFDVPDDEGIVPTQAADKPVLLKPNGPLKSTTIDSKDVLEKPVDPDTVKQIKKLFNGIIAIQKVLDSHAEYQGASYFTAGMPAIDLLSNLSHAYTCFKEFNYQEFLAEEANPFAEIVKKALEKMNVRFEKLACIFGQYEAEYGLKRFKNIVSQTDVKHESTASKYLQYMMDRYNQITGELKIRVDYLVQKRLFQSARLKFNQDFIAKNTIQISQLERFSKYKNFSLASIPRPVLRELHEYIHRYSDDLSMNHEHLERYKRYLKDVINEKHQGFASYMSQSVEYLATIIGKTVHYEVMEALRVRRLQLITLQDIFTELVKDQQDDIKNKPYDHFNLVVDDKKVTIAQRQEIVAERLRWRAFELEREKIELDKSVLKPQAQPKPKAVPARVFSEKVMLEISKIKFFLHYENQSLDELPSSIIHELQAILLANAAFLNSKKEDITQFNRYLMSVLKSRENKSSSIIDLDFITENFYWMEGVKAYKYLQETLLYLISFTGKTSVHSRIMHAFKERLQSVEKYSVELSTAKYKHHPIKIYKPINAEDQKKDKLNFDIVLSEFKKKVVDLDSSKKSMTGFLHAIRNEPKPHVSDRIQKQINSKTQELTLFSKVVSKYKKNEELLPYIAQLRTQELSPTSTILLQEAEEILRSAPDLSPVSVGFSK